MFEPIEYDFDSTGPAVIKVVGVGGGGGNAVSHMVANIVKNDFGGTFTEVGEFCPTINDENGQIFFYAVNTDAQALLKSNVQQTVQIGKATTRGLGAGANPNIGRKAAEDDHEAIRAILEGADMVFIAAGMGGGTGTGAAPVVAQIAKEMGILTVAVVTKPFAFEGKKRMQFAELGIRELSKYVDSLIVIPNEKLQKALKKDVTLIEAFATANDVLRNAVTGISDLITAPGIINLDFADVRTVMSGMGRSMMGSGVFKGSVSDNRAELAAKEAVASPLLEDMDLSNAKGVLVNITSGDDLTLEEFKVVGEVISTFASEDATIVVGTSVVPGMSNEIRVTIVATGIGDVDTPDIQIKTKVEQPTRIGFSDMGASSDVVQSENWTKPATSTGTSYDKSILDRPISERLNERLNKDNMVNVGQFMSQKDK